MALISYQRGRSVPVTANFSSGEFDCKGARCRCTVTRIDSRLARKLQMLRRLCGSAVYITSGNRCPTHNRSVGGSSASFHLNTTGKAADIVVAGMTPAQVAKLAQQLGFTGIGRYDGTAGRFVHVDVRPKAYYWHNTSGTDRPVSGHGGTRQTNPYKRSTVTLRRGSDGDGVRHVQWALNRFGYRCAVDGNFGPATLAAVKDLQRDLLLETDGIVGPDTHAALREVLA